jgi:hypothetical protein
VDADAPTEIFVDKVSIGTTPITKWPLRPGARKVVAKGPKGKVQKFDVTVYAAQEVTPADDRLVAAPGGRAGDLRRCGYDSGARRMLAMCMPLSCMHTICTRSPV